MSCCGAREERTTAWTHPRDKDTFTAAACMASRIFQVSGLAQSKLGSFGIEIDPLNARVLY